MIGFALSALIITACVLSFVYSAAPGAVNTEAVRRGLQRGFVPSFLVQIGAVLGDLVWAMIGLAGVALLLQVLPVRIMLGIAGVATRQRSVGLRIARRRKPRR